MIRLSLPAMTQTRQLPCIFLSFAHCATQYMMMSVVRTRPSRTRMDSIILCSVIASACTSQQASLQMKKAIPAEIDRAELSCHLLNRTCHQSGTALCNYRDTDRLLSDGPSARARMAWCHSLQYGAHLKFNIVRNGDTTHNAQQCNAVQCNHSTGVLAPCLVSCQGCAARGKLSAMYRSFP